MEISISESLDFEGTKRSLGTARSLLPGQGLQNCPGFLITFSWTCPRCFDTRAVVRREFHCRPALMELSWNTHRTRIACLASAVLLSWCGAAVAVAGVSPAQPWARGLFLQACHQIPERCYSWHGHPIGLCVRCLWIYLGLALGHPLFSFWRLSEKAVLRSLYVVAGLMFADVAFETMGIYHNIFVTRAITGAGFGLVCSWFTLEGLFELSSNRENKKPAHAS